MAAIKEGQRCLRQVWLHTKDLLNLDLHYETDSVSLNPLRRAHRVCYRARQVRPVDCGGSCDRDPTVEYRGTSATPSRGLAEARPKRLRFQEVVCNARWNM